MVGYKLFSQQMINNYPLFHNSDSLIEVLVWESIHNRRRRRNSRTGPHSFVWYLCVLRIQFLLRNCYHVTTTNTVTFFGNIQPSTFIHSLQLPLLKSQTYFHSQTNWFFMASATRVTNCDLRPPKVSSSRSRPRKAVPVQFSIPEPESANTNIVLQPRLCTLRSYGSDPVGAVIKTRKEEEDMQVTDDVSSFFATLSEYIESSKKSQDFEIISGRLAMVTNPNTNTFNYIIILSLLSVSVSIYTIVEELIVAFYSCGGADGVCCYSDGGVGDGEFCVQENGYCRDNGGGWDLFWCGYFGGNVCLVLKCSYQSGSNLHSQLQLLHWFANWSNHWRFVLWW